MHFSLWQGALVEFCVKIKVYQFPKESNRKPKVRVFNCPCVLPRALHQRCEWVSDGHVYFFHKVQPLAQSESHSGLEARSRLGSGEDAVRVKNRAGGGDD